MDDAQELAKLRRLKELEDRAAGVPETTFMDQVKNVGTAIYKGIGSLGAGAADAYASGYDVSDLGSVFSGKAPRKLDDTMPVSRALEETGYQPKNAQEKFVNSGVRGAAGALIGPGALSAPIRTMATGAISGLSGEAAGQAFKGSPNEGIARFGGAVVGGVAGGLATATVGNTKELAAEMLKGTTERELKRARLVMEQAKDKGLPLNLDQAYGKDTNITNMVKTLATRTEGQPIVDQLRQQPEQALKMANRIPNSLPGKVQEPAKIANSSQSAATEAITTARKYRTAQTEPIFAQSGTAPAELLDDIAANLKARIAAAPDTNKAALLSELEKVVSGASKRATPAPSGLVDANGNPFPTSALPTSIQELNASMRSLMTNAKNINRLNSTAGDREATGALQASIKEIRERLGAVSPKFQEANDMYAAISRDLVDPLKKSAVGRVAGITGELADKEAVSKMLPILAKGRNPQSDSSEIRDLAKAMKDQPEVFQDAVKTHISNAIAQAESRTNGVLTPAFAGDLEKNLFGTANQRQGMKDQLTEIAKQQGLTDPSLLYRGFKSAFQIIGASAKRPGSIGPGAGEMEEIARKSIAAKGLSMIGMAPGKPLGKGLEGMYSAAAYKTIAANLTTPEGVAKLQALAKLPVMSNQARTIVSTLLSAEANNESNPATLQISNTAE